MRLSVYLYNSAFLEKLPPSKKKTKKNVSPSLCHAVSPSLNTPVCTIGLNRSLGNRRENEEKWKAFRQSDRSIWILFTVKPFACVVREAFWMVGMTTSRLMAQPGPLCHSLSVWGLRTQLQPCAIWGPILDRLHAERVSVEPQMG